MSTRNDGIQRVEDSLQSASISYIQSTNKWADLIVVAYIDESGNSRQSNVPLKIHASEKRVFNLHRDYGGVDNLLIVYVWGVNSAVVADAILALTYEEAMNVANAKPYPQSNSWSKGGSYNINAGQALQQMLAPYHIPPQTWQDRIEAALK